MSALPPRADLAGDPSRSTLQTILLNLYDMVAQRLAAGTTGAGTASAAELKTARDTLGLGAGLDIASAATLDLTGRTGNIVRITGTIATTAVALNNGDQVWCYAVGAWPLTYNATTMPTPGGVSYTCAAGDVVLFTKDGSGVITVEIYPKSGQPIAQVITAKIADANVTPAKLSQPFTAGTAVATTSGSAVDFTGIPSWAKRISVVIENWSDTTGNSPRIQIGAGSVDVTGYAGVCMSSAAGGTAGSALSAGFEFRNAGGAGDIINGVMVLHLVSPNKWVASGLATGNTYSMTTSGVKSLSGALDRVRLTVASGAFDGGSVNLFYE